MGGRRGGGAGLKGRRLRTGPQSEQDVSPRSLYLPATHSVQIVASPAALYLPASHQVQADAPLLLYVPCGTKVVWLRGR